MEIMIRLYLASLYLLPDFQRKGDRGIRRNNLAFPERIIYAFHDIINGSMEKPNTKED
jgi:hypothetical protein